MFLWVESAIAYRFSAGTLYLDLVEEKKLSQLANESGLKRIYSKLSAETAEDIVFRNQALLELGTLYVEKCDLKNAAECFEKVKTEALQFHLYDNYFLAVNRLLRIHAERLDADSQNRLKAEAFQVGSTLSSFKRYQPCLHYNQGIISFYTKDFKAAEAEFTQAITVGESVLTDAKLSQVERRDILRYISYAQYGLIVVAKDQGQADKALESIKKLKEAIAEQVTLDAELDLFELETSVGITEGHCLRDLGQIPQALDRYWEVHRHLKTRKVWNHYYYVLLALGRAYQLAGDSVKANTFFDLVRDAVQSLELNALKLTLQSYSEKATSTTHSKLLVDRERKRIVEENIGEVHFERRFVLLEILYLLAADPGRVFGKEELVGQIWGENYNPMIHDSKVYTSISRLRKLIEPDFRHPRYILNERDGYAFNPSVQVVETGGADNAALQASRSMTERKTTSH